MIRQAPVWMVFRLDASGHRVELPLPEEMAAQVKALAKSKGLPDEAILNVLYGRMMAAAAVFLKSQGA